MAKSFWRNIKIKESSLSLFLGIVVVIIIGVLVFNYINKGRPGKPKPEAPATQEVAPPGETLLPTKHTIVEGEDLWKISEKYFKTGYNWVDIARENNLDNPDLIAVGSELVIPKVEPKTLPTTGVTSPPETPSITGASYTVIKGDTLWDIAVRAYGDGYKWVEIAKVNNLANPDLIHAGNVFTLPR